MQSETSPTSNGHSIHHPLASQWVVRIAEGARDWGWFAVAATPTGVCGATFGHENALAAGKALEEEAGMSPGTNVDAETIAAAAVRELHAFFAGEGLTTFSVPVTLNGTPFQRAVWAETNSVEFGKLATYQEIARRIGRPLAYRAVGNALGQNPLPIIVPCHRVIASDGTFGGYTRGLPWKERLLALEGSLALVQPR